MEERRRRNLFMRVVSTPVGQFVAVSDGVELLELRMKERDEALFGGETNKCSLFDRVENWLAAYFAGENPPVDFPLALKGSVFRRRVWEILREIPYGQTTTYGEIARRIAAETGRVRLSAQAVGGAVGHNPVWMIVPCHRVVGANGSLTGYAGGLGLKIALLRHEGVDMRLLFLPEEKTAPRM